VRRAGVALPLVDAIPDEFKVATLDEAQHWSDPVKDDNQEKSEQSDGLTIKLTSFQGAKGLSAQHVFIVGLHAGELPHDDTDIADLEICKFLVGLTRTKKQCTLMWTKNFANAWKERSVFLDWIRPERCESVHVDANYWVSHQ
jgi:superfamily I DNA/RNA helicase